MLSLDFFNKKRNLRVAKTSTIVVVDNLVSAIDNSINGGQPLLGTSWSLLKGIYGASVELRQERAIEFIEMIRDNPSIFTKEVLATEEFQDGFVYTFQKYLNERIAKKRKIIKEVFFGFSSSTLKQDFKLERLLFTLEQLSLEDIEVIKIFSDGTILLWDKNQFPNMSEEEALKMSKQPLNVGQVGEHILSKMKGLKQFKDNDYTVEILLRLSSLGLVLGGIDASYDYSSSNFRESKFGKEFVSYVLE